jgi:hypothetical protein
MQRACRGARSCKEHPSIPLPARGRTSERAFRVQCGALDAENSVVPLRVAQCTRAGRKVTDCRSVGPEQAERRRYEPVIRVEWRVRAGEHPGTAAGS